MAGLCKLQYTLGRVEACPGARCPFWVVESAEACCVLAGAESEFDGRPALAQHLLELRTELDNVRRPREGWVLFHRLLNEEQEAEG